MVSSMSVPGSGTNFLRYESAVRIGAVTFIDNGGEDLNELFYHRCAP